MRARPHSTNGSVTTESPNSSAPLAAVVVETQGLHKTYGGKITVPVLRGIDLQIRAGDFVALVGQSGSGKSTLLHLLGALDVPTAGRVLINGEDLTTLSEDELALLRSEAIGFIFQSHHLLPEFTCLENALMPLIIRHGIETQAQRARVIHLLQRVGLGHHLHKRPDEMSGGQTNAAPWCARSRMRHRSCLPMKPTGNLDSRSGAEVFALMREINRERGVAFVMVTHDERLAQTADRIVVIEDGVLQKLGHV